MPRPCKTRKDLVNRYEAFKRLGRIKNFISGIPPIEIYNIRSIQLGHCSGRVKGMVSITEMEKFL